jgi:hypothetical protein
LASFAAGRVRLPRASRDGLHRSSRSTALVRTTIPLIYAGLAGVASETVRPTWAGLVATFPSLSTVILAVTHLEEGPTQASRIASTLPPANLSTAAFLAGFRFACPILGLGWATFLGYLAALASTAALEGFHRREALKGFGFANECRRRTSRPSAIAGSGLPGRWTNRRPDRRALGSRRPHHRRSFAPRVEALTC